MSENNILEFVQREVDEQDDYLFGLACDILLEPYKADHRPLDVE